MSAKVETRVSDARQIGGPARRAVVSLLLQGFGSHHALRILYRELRQLPVLDRLSRIW